MPKNPLKLPKTLTTDPKHDAIQERLGQNASPLWENGRTPIPTLPLTPALKAELAQALNTRTAVQGLEAIARTLGDEQKGLDNLAAKTPNQPRGHQISRLLIMANDGAERFYRECDSLLARYEDRLTGIKLNVPGEELGAALSPSPRLIRAILITDKKAVARVLLSLV